MTDTSAAETQQSIEELLETIQCEGLDKLKGFFPDLDFKDVLTEKPHLAEFLEKQIEHESIKVTDPLLLANAPKLNEDFSNYFVINNLP